MPPPPKPKTLLQLCFERASIMVGPLIMSMQVEDTTVESSLGKEWQCGGDNTGLGTPNPPYGMWHMPLVQQQFSMSSSCNLVSATTTKATATITSSSSSTPAQQVSSTSRFDVPRVEQVPPPSNFLLIDQPPHSLPPQLEPGMSDGMMLRVQESMDGGGQEEDMGMLYNALHSTLPAPTPSVRNSLMVSPSRELSHPEAMPGFAGHYDAPVSASEFMRNLAQAGRLRETDQEAIFQGYPSASGVEYLLHPSLQPHLTDNVMEVSANNSNGVSSSTAMSGWEGREDGVGCSRPQVGQTCDTAASGSAGSILDTLLSDQHPVSISQLIGGALKMGPNEWMNFEPQ